MVIGPFSQLTSDRTIGNGLYLHQEKFKLDIRKNFSLKVWSGIGIGCSEKWWYHHPSKNSKDAWMCYLGTQFTGEHGGAELTVAINKEVFSNLNHSTIIRIMCPSIYSVIQRTWQLQGKEPINEKNILLGCFFHSVLGDSYFSLYHLYIYFISNDFSVVYWKNV